uniref:Uncharacterized protein n=1 Tax=Romanomermis culicivorax TaxID=13658 RepID=A0A915KFX7_ROMCU
TKDRRQGQVNVESKEQHSTSLCNAVQQDWTSTIGDGLPYGPYCMTYGSANGATSEESNAVNDAISARPKCWRLPVRGTFTDVLLSWTLHPQQCQLPGPTS